MRLCERFAKIFGGKCYVYNRAPNQAFVAVHAMTEMGTKEFSISSNEYSSEEGAWADLDKRLQTMLTKVLNLNEEL